MAKPKYKWDVWLKKGSQHIIERGIDYKAKTNGFIVYLYQVAASKSVNLSIIKIEKNKLQITVHNGKLDGRTNWREEREKHDNA